MAIYPCTKSLLVLELCHKMLRVARLAASQNLANYPEVLFVALLPVRHMATQGGSIEMSSEPILPQAEVFSQEEVCEEVSGDAVASEPTEVVAAPEEPAAEQPSDVAPEEPAVEQPLDAAPEEPAMEQPSDAAPEQDAEPAEAGGEPEEAPAEQPYNDASVPGQVSRDSVASASCSLFESTSFALKSHKLMTCLNTPLHSTVLREQMKAAVLQYMCTCTNDRNATLN